MKPQQGSGLKCLSSPRCRKGKKEGEEGSKGLCMPGKLARTVRVTDPHVFQDPLRLIFSDCANIYKKILQICGRPPSDRTRNVRVFKLPCPQWYLVLKRTTTGGRVVSNYSQTLVRGLAQSLLNLQITQLALYACMCGSRLLCYDSPVFVTWFAPVGPCLDQPRTCLSFQRLNPHFSHFFLMKESSESRDQVPTPTVQFQKESMTRDLTKKVLPTLLGARNNIR